VIVDPQLGTATVLNGFASMIWGYLDGQTSLRELSADVAYAFDAPVEATAEFLLTFGRDIARAGLLENVGTAGDPEAHGGAGIGDLIGDVIDWSASERAGRQALLVNWNAHCGYCVALASELAALTEALQVAKVDIVLLASGAASDGGFDDPFPNLGTPAAYLVDDGGVVLADLALGAVEVAQLARRASGQPEPAADPGDRYLRMPSASGQCRPDAGGRRREVRSRAEASTYEVNGVWVGVRSDSEATEWVVRRALSAYHVPGRSNPPAHLSVVLPTVDSDGRRLLNLLLVGDQTVLRSRSPRRVVRALAAYLSMLVADQEGTLAPPGTYAVSAMAALVGTDAVLLPRHIPTAAVSRLARAGFRMVDLPVAILDPASGELVVPQGLVEIDEEAFDLVPETDLGGTEGAWVPPGRYPLRAWALGVELDRADDFTAARAVAAAWALCLGSPSAPEATLQLLVDLLERLPTLPVSLSDVGRMIDDLRSLDVQRSA
jgi:Coenzyme PQQ synthesis protein D (PqqD)